MIIEIILNLIKRRKNAFDLGKFNNKKQFFIQGKKKKEKKDFDQTLSRLKAFY